MSRRYHAMLTRYNIAYNGNVSYKEGMENIAKSGKDNYAQMIELFPISYPGVAAGAAGNMDRAIEKSRKAIKQHSIKKKPEKDSRRMSDPKYRAFYNQNEYNPELKKAWIQLGKAEFHKGEFLGAAGTFSYVSRYYESQPEVATEAQIWLARAYCELDWVYEAENVLKKIRKEHISPAIAGIYGATYAQLLIMQNDYAQAIPHLESAIKSEKDKKQRARFQFVLAQMQERTGNKKAALECYSRVLKSSPPYEMDFNARVNRVQLLSKNGEAVRRELKSMARNKNNKDYLDQIYTAMGNSFMTEKDTARAVKNYNLAIEKSTRNSFEKAVPLIILADFYYKKKEYVTAQPYYDEAAKIYTNEQEGYEQIKQRAEALADLVKEYEVVHLQDSLQSLARMSEKERLAAIERVIEKLKEEEKLDKEKKAVQASNNNQMIDDFAMPMNQIGGGSNWYFYNPVSINNGKTEFRRRWGNRKLEDNWRRINKSSALIDENELANNVTDTTSIAQTDSTLTEVAEPVIKQTNDRKSVDYYLAQIPFTATQKQKSDEQLATGIYNMAFAYKDKVEDNTLAYKSFDEFAKRFPKDERILETLFQQFLMASKENNSLLAQQFRNRILAEYAESKQAETLADPDYIRNQQRMFEVQDELYNQAYAAFIASDYSVVFKNAREIKTKYPLATLLPQFEFLNTLSIGKTKGAKEFETSLDSLVLNYPNSNIGAMSKDMLALLKQGNIAQQGGSFGSLLTKREKDNLTPEEQKAMSFSELKFTPHRMMFITDAGNEAINKLQYNLAIFNFSRFMIKDFGFALTQVDGNRRALCVLNLASYNEGIWYRNTLATDKELMAQMKAMNVRQVIVSEDNFGKLRTNFTLEDYLTFDNDILSKDIPVALLAATDAPKTNTQPKVTKVEIIDGTKLIEKKPEEKTTVTTTQQPEAKQATKTENALKTETTVKAVAEKQVAKAENLTKTEQKPTQTTPEKEMVASTKQNIQTATTPKTETTTSPGNNIISNTAPKIDTSAQLYKNLFALTPGAPHYVAFYIPRGGKFDFNLIKMALDEYNAANYGAMNLKVSREEYGRETIIFVSSFADLNVAKSYFLRMLKEPVIVKATTGMNKRNLIVTRDNLNVLLHNNALDVYFEFMKTYYLAP